MSKIKLSIATTDYDHFRDFRMGVVRAEGIDHNWLNLGHHECFARFTANREFDVSELSLRQVLDAGHAREQPTSIGLPVDLLAPVPLLLVLREQELQDQDGAGPQGQAASARRNGRIRRPSTCAAGCTTICGVKLTDVHWYQAGANAPGRAEKVELNLPEG